MKSTDLLGCAGLAACALASKDVPAQLPITGQNPTDNPRVYSVPLDTLNSLLHTVNITIGTPPQHFNVSLDFQSNTFFVPSTGWSSRDYEKRKYDSEASTSYLPHGAPAAAEHLFVAYEGILSGDTVRVGGLEIEVQIFEEFTRSFKGMFGAEADYDGAMGLRPPWHPNQSVNRYPNYLSMLQSEDLLEEDIFSLKIPRSLEDKGEITFGGSNPEQYTGAFRNVSLQPEGAVYPEWRGDWAIPLDSLTLNTDVPLHFPTGNYSAILVSLPILILPATFVNSLEAAVGVQLRDLLFTPIPCERRAELPEIVFDFGGERFGINGWDYVFEVPFGDDDEVECGIWVEECEDTGVGENTVVVGTGFLKRWYSRWDFGGDPKIGFAEIK